MIRALRCAGVVLLCLPMLFLTLIVSGSTGNAVPGLVALAAIVPLLWSAWTGRWSWYVVLPALALFAVLAATILDTTVVETEAELRSARFGVPFDFVEAKLSANPPLPYQVGWNPWEDPAELDVLLFLGSYVLVLGALALAVAAMKGLTRRQKFVQLT